MLSSDKYTHEMSPKISDLVKREKKGKGEGNV